MNKEHKDLLIAAAKAAGIEIQCRKGSEIPWLTNDEGDPWNPFAFLSDRYDLARRCKLVIDFEYGTVWNTHDFAYAAYAFNDDESEALAILRAAVASKESE